MGFPYLGAVYWTGYLTLSNSVPPYWLDIPSGYYSYRIDGHLDDLPMKAGDLQRQSQITRGVNHIQQYDYGDYISIIRIL